MTGNTRLRERDNELFVLVNTLKAQEMVYQKTSPQLYGDLVSRRSEVDEELGADDCYMRIVPEKGLIVLSFYPDDQDYRNGLRKKFSLNEMRFYISILQLYSERYIADGDYVTVGTEDIINAWDRLGLSSKTAAVNRKFLEPYIKEMKRHGILAATGSGQAEQYVIQPGVMFGLDMPSLMEYYGSVLEPWLTTAAEKEREKKEAGNGAQKEEM